MHTQLQSTFPGGHTFVPPARVAEVVEKLIDDNAISSGAEQCTTRQILSTLQPLYEKE